jgi:uncharacterized short protein YbdD (DUF466 family)
MESGRRPGRIERWWQSLLWFLREVSGEADYPRYLRQVESLGHGATPLSRREFERRRMAAREGTAVNRCC